MKSLPSLWLACCALLLGACDKKSATEVKPPESAPVTAKEKRTGKKKGPSNEDWMKFSSLRKSVFLMDSVVASTESMKTSTFAETRLRAERDVVKHREQSDQHRAELEAKRLEIEALLDPRGQQLFATEIEQEAEVLRLRQIQREASSASMRSITYPRDVAREEELARASLAAEDNLMAAVSVLAEIREELSPLLFDSDADFETIQHHERLAKARKK